MMLLALLGVVERRFLSILSGSIGDSIHIDNVVAVLLGSQGAFENLPVLPYVPALSIRQKVPHIDVQPAVGAYRRVESSAPISGTLGALVTEHAFRIGSDEDRQAPRNGRRRPFIPNTAHGKWRDYDTLRQRVHSKQ
jgi:hypothetical protein